MTSKFVLSTTSPHAPPICGGVFDEARVSKELTELETRIAAPDFWKDQAAAQKILQKRRRLQDDKSLAESLRKQSDDLGVLLEWARQGEEVGDDLTRGLEAYERDIQNGEIRTMLGGDLDRKNAIVSIHPGAGGTESQDWAEMLLRMYLRWAEREGLDVEVDETLLGDEAGIKSATFIVHGPYAYGLLSAERGVHRLVRISPFDAQKRRHTSFANLDVIPLLEETADEDIVIDPKDLRIDVYRSTGPGGQSVNTTDSAVRITHLPSGISAACQNERSQLQNRAVAMRILKARLAQRMREEQQTKLENLRGERKGIDFGSQIRSYVLAPYRLVKDHRTGVEIGDVDRVLDGDLEELIEAELRRRAEPDTAS